MKIKVAAIQSDIAFGDISENEKRITAALREAAGAGVDIAVLPELWNSGYDLENLDNLAQKEKGSSMTLLKALAKECKMNIVGGSLAEKRDSGIYNMTPLINRKGIITEKYRKVHLFPLVLEEQRYFTAGDSWGIGEADDIPLGLMLCYDLRFPEFCRNIVLRGAKVVFVPAEWPKERIAHWRVLLQSRAIENQVFVVGVNRVGRDDTSVYNGHSLIIDPYGNVLAEGSQEEEIIYAELDLSQVDEFRKKIPTITNRLNILDEIDNNFL